MANATNNHQLKKVIKKILHISPSYKPATPYGGPIISVSSLCESQIEVGNEVWVLTTTANGSTELIVPRGKAHYINGVAVYYHRRYTKDHSHLSPGLWLRLWQMLPQADYVHIHSWWNLVTMPALLICLLRGRRPVLSPRGMLSPYTLRHPVKVWFHRIIGRHLLIKAVIHATSAQEAQEIASIIPGSTIFLSPNIVQLPDATQVALASQDKSVAPSFSLLFLSRIDPKKGLEHLFLALQNCTFPWRLVLAGKGDAEYTSVLIAQAQALGISERLEWYGWASSTQKYSLMAEANLLVLPSQNENFANVVIEALAVGTPVLLSPQVGLSDYVLEHDFGWVTLNDPGELAQTLEQAWLAKEKRRRIQAESPAYIQIDFNPGAVVTQYLEAYQRYE